MIGTGSLDFSTTESSYPQLFAALRKAGWHPARRVDFPDAQTIAELEDGVLVLNDHAETFLRAFYGLHLNTPTRSVTIAFDKPWPNMHFADDGWCINAFASEQGVGGFPYPFCVWDSLVGFITSEGRALAVDEFYQVYLRAESPLDLLDHVLFGRPHVGIQKGYLDRQYVPTDYKHLIWDRPLSYHLPRYRTYALTEGTERGYLLESVDSKHYGIRVSELREQGSDLFVDYARDNLEMAPDVVRNLIVFKLLDEFLGGHHRERTTRIRLKDLRTGESTVLGWPRR